jgi:hypothetical protein
MLSLSIADEFFTAGTRCYLSLQVRSSYNDDTGMVLYLSKMAHIKNKKNCSSFVSPPESDYLSPRFFSWFTPFFKGTFSLFRLDKNINNSSESLQ